MEERNVITTLKAIGDLSNEGVFVYNTATNRLDYTNAALTRIWDISHQSFNAEPSFYIHHLIEEDSKHLKDAYETLKKERKSEEVEFRIKGHDWRIKDIVGRFYLLCDGKLIVGFVKDNTAAKEHANYIINYGAKKDTVLDLLTHNLSAPLMLSNSIVSSLEKAIEKNDVKLIRKHLQLIKDNISDSIDLVNDFLEEEHMVSEQIHTKSNRFDAVEKITKLLERYKSSHTHNFIFNRPVDALYVTNDDVKFLQVISNLVSNAVKFSRNDKTIEVRLEDYENHIAVSVADEGIGIPDHLKGQIFQRHTPAGRTGLRGEKSIGIGLYVVRKLLTLMKGSIAFESKENAGSTFVVRLPKDLDAVRDRNPIN